MSAASSVGPKPHKVFAFTHQDNSGEGLYCLSYVYRSGVGTCGVVPCPLPPYQQIYFPRCQLPEGDHSPEANDPLSDNIRSATANHYVTMPVSFTSFHLIT